MSQPLVSTGRVWFAAPNQFRWEIGNPAQTIAARSADEMLVIYPRLKRVEKYPLGTNEIGQFKETLALLEAGFPRSQAELENQFRVIGTTSTNKVASISLEPKSPAARRMMPKIVIQLSTNDFMLRATELYFSDGSVMRNDFYNARTNPAVDPAIFKPLIERGFTIAEPMKRAK